MHPSPEPSVQYSLWDRLQQQDEDICAVRHQFAAERHTLQTQLRVQAQQIEDLQRSTEALRRRLTERDSEQHVQSERIAVLITERDELFEQKRGRDRQIGDLSRQTARLRDEVRRKDQQASRTDEQSKSMTKELHNQIEVLKTSVDSGSQLTKKLSDQMAAIEQNSDLRAAQLQVQLALCQCEMDEKQRMMESQDSSRRSYNEIVKRKVAAMDRLILEERTCKKQVIQEFEDVSVRVDRLHCLSSVFRPYYESSDPTSFCPVSVLEASVAYRGYWLKFDEMKRLCRV